MSSNPIDDQIELKKLNHENKQLKKNTKKIESSRWYKIAKLITWPSKLFPSQRKAAAYKKAYQQLQNENQRLNRYISQRFLESLDSENEFDVKSLRESGQTLDVAHDLLEKKRHIDSQYIEVMDKLARSFTNENELIRNRLYQIMINNLNIEEIPEYIVRYSYRNTNVDLQKSASFTTLLNIQASRSQEDPNAIEKQFDHKKNAYDFVDIIGIERPWTSFTYNGFTTIPEQYGVVIKPTEGAGSRGVYLATEPGKIINIKTGHYLNDWNMLTESISNDISNANVLKDEWYLEELIEDDGNPTTDFKFYTFYGQVALILEISRIPEVKYCWWNREGQRLSLGKYNDDLYQGEGVSQEMIEYVESISLELPVPFMRIDFMKNKEQFIFNEFTPYPGNYDEFYEETDQKLGTYYLKAEDRLKRDLLAKKEFKLYNQWSDHIVTSEEDHNGKHK